MFVIEELLSVYLGCVSIFTASKLTVFCVACTVDFRSPNRARERTRA